MNSRPVRIAMCLVALVGVAWSGQAADPPATGKAAFLRGLAALEIGKAADAVMAFDKAIEADEENADYRTARGVAQIAGEKPKQAIKDLERSLRLRENDRLTRMWLAVAVAMTGDLFRSSEVFPVATNDLNESRIRQASHDYGDPVFRAERGEPVPGARPIQAKAMSEIAAGIRWWVGKLKSQPGMSGELLTLAREAVARGDYAGALPDLTSALSSDPENVELLHLHATCLLNLGNASGARGELTRALTGRTQYGEAYLARALAAARLGDARRAKADLAVGTKLAPAEAALKKAAIEKELAAIASGSTPPTLAALIEAAKGGASDEELTRLAVALRKSNAGQRRRYDEWYQDRLRELEDALRAEPKNAERLVALAGFLYDESTVRRERVGPRGNYTLFRYQTPSSQERELARSEELVDQALKISPKHVDGLTVKARLRMWHSQFADAETLIRQALALSPNSVEVLELYSEVLEVAAAQRSAQAAELRRPKYLGSDEERVGDYIYTYSYYHHPSQAELAEAKVYDEQADMLAAEALAQFQKAAQLKRGTAQGHYFQGVALWHQGEYEAARKSYEEAVRLEPTNVRWHFNLAGIYAALGLNAEAMQERLVATNLVETTAAPLVNLAWDPIMQTKWKTAREILTKAAALDEVDSRIPAYLGVVYAADEKPEEAVAAYRAALALEEARAQLAGTTLGPQGKGSLSVADYGLALTLRHRAAALLIELDRADEALVLELASVAGEKRAGGQELSTEVASALLPDPTFDLHTVPEAENVLTLFAWARVGAGAAHNKLKDYRNAVAVLEPVAGFETMLTNGVGADRLRKPTLYAALELGRAYLGLGDLNRAQQYAMQLPRKRFGAGPSKGPFPELEDAGSELMEEIARRRGG